MMRTSTILLIQSGQEPESRGTLPIRGNRKGSQRVQDSTLWEISFDFIDHLSINVGGVGN